MTTAVRKHEKLNDTENNTCWKVYGSQGSS